MKPFVFRLQTALDMKLHQEDQGKVDLEKATRIYDEIIRQLKAMQKHLEWVQEELRTLQEKEIKIDEIKSFQDFIPVLLQRIENQARDAEEKKAKVNQQRAALVEIMKERKVLEKIKSRNYQEYRRQALLEEQKQIDEMAIHRFTRKNNPT